MSRPTDCTVFSIAPFLSYIVYGTCLRNKKNSIIIRTAAIKEASELDIDTSGCRMHNNVAPPGKSPRDASIALLIASVSHLLFNACSRSQYLQKKMVLTVATRIGVGSRVIGSHGPLIPNPNPNTKRRIRQPVIGTVLRAAGPHTWDIQFDHDGKVKTGVSSRAVKLVPEGSGIPLNEASMTTPVYGASNAVVRVSALVFVCNCF